MNRAQLRQLAEDRILDAEHLLAAGRWSGAYFMAGYAVECGLKACIVAYVEATGVIFQDKKFSEKCWTHNLVDLLKLANLADDFEAAGRVNSTLYSIWKLVVGWNEVSRYEQKSELETRELFEAITNDPDGVLRWIRPRW